MKHHLYLTFIFALLSTSFQTGWGEEFSSTEADGHIESSVAHSSNMDQYNQRLWKAFYDRDFDELISYFSQEISFDLKKPDGHETMLHIAALNGDIQMVRFLLHCNANVNGLNNFNETPLIYAATSGDKALSVVKLLLEGGAVSSIDTANNHQGQTALHRAYLANSYNTVDLLLRYGANPNIQDCVQKFILRDAILKHDSRMVELLLAYDVNVNLQDANGQTVLHLLAEMRNFSRIDAYIMHLIIQYGNADLTIMNSSGLDPLQTAITANNLSAAYILLDGGANPYNENAAAKISGNAYERAAFAKNSYPATFKLMDEWCDPTFLIKAQRLAGQASSSLLEWLPSYYGDYIVYGVVKKEQWDGKVNLVATTGTIITSLVAFTATAVLSIEPELIPLFFKLWKNLILRNRDAETGFGFGFGEHIKEHQN